MIEWIRGEMVGPARPIADATVVGFTGKDFTDLVPLRRGQLSWRPAPDAEAEEVLYFDRESPHRKYGTGLLHPVGVTVLVPVVTPPPDAAMQATDTVGVDADPDEAPDADADGGGNDAVPSALPVDATDDFEVTSPDIRHPSTIGLSFCVRLNETGRIVVRLPRSRRFAWQVENLPAFLLNGRYEACKRRWTNENGAPQEGPMWRRHPAMLPETAVTVERAELVHGHVIRKAVSMPAGSPLNLVVEIFPRRQRVANVWLLTVILRNDTQPPATLDPKEAILYQTCFEVLAEGGCLEKYPESQRPFTELDEEEKSLALLYRESATWGIGHGCAAGWDAEPGQSPELLFVDVMPAVQLPSMTPDITDESGNRIQLSMRSLAGLSDNGSGPAWDSLDNLSAEYAAWIGRSRVQIENLDANFDPVATPHLVPGTPG